MIDDLCAEMEIVGNQMQILVDGLELTRGRLRTSMARLVIGLPPLTAGWRRRVKTSSPCCEEAGKVAHSAVRRYHKKLTIGSKEARRA